MRVPYRDIAVVGLALLIIRPPTWGDTLLLAVCVWFTYKLTLFLTER